MKFIPKLIPRKNKKPTERFVVLDIGLGRVNIAIFDTTSEGPKFVGVGRRSFGSSDTILDATLEATDALGAIVDELPQRAIVGVSGGKMKTLTTIARYDREKPNRPIDSEEVSSVIEKLASGAGEEKLKVFFSTVVSAKIDGAKVTNPIGVKGTKAEITCFVALKPPEELSVYDQIIDELEIKPEKIVPSCFAVSQMVGKKITEDSLLLRVGQNKTEATFLKEGHLTNVFNLDIGYLQIDFFNTAVDVLLEEREEKERPKLIWLYSDSDETNLVEIKEKLEETGWEKGLKFKEAPKIERAETENNFGPADTVLLALSLEEILER